eukprot:gene25693-34267_t
MPWTENARLRRPVDVQLHCGHRQVASCCRFTSAAKISKIRCSTQVSLKVPHCWSAQRLEPLTLLTAQKCVGSLYLAATRRVGTVGAVRRTVPAEPSAAEPSFASWPCHGGKAAKRPALFDAPTAMAPSHAMKRARLICVGVRASGKLHAALWRAVFSPALQPALLEASHCLRTSLPHCLLLSIARKKRTIVDCINMS